VKTKKYGGMAQGIRHRNKIKKIKPLNVVVEIRRGTT
jgi:hypothetical protein